MVRQLPYGAFEFIVNFTGAEAFGGFSEVSGIGSELTVAEYRHSNDKESHLRKVHGVRKVGEVTLKRGVVNSESAWQWIRDVRSTGVTPQKDVSITLLDEARHSVLTWLLRNARPMKYTGPTPATEGVGDVAVEELVLSFESLEVEAD